MPSFRRSRPRRSTRTRRSRGRRRGTVRRRRFGITRQVQMGLPDSIFVDLKYCNTFQSSGLTHTQQFRANSCFDPDLSGGGHQPHYFDQYAALYRKYMVYSCKIQLRIMNQAASSLMIGVWPSVTSAILVSSPQDLLEEPYVRSTMLAQNNAQPVKHLSHFMTTKKMRGGAVMDDEFGAVVTNNPARGWVWTVFAAGLGGGSTDFDYSVVLTQRVRFYSRANVGSS